MNYVYEFDFTDLAAFSLCLDTPGFSGNFLSKSLRASSSKSSRSVFDPLAILEMFSFFFRFGFTFFWMLLTEAVSNSKSYFTTSYLFLLSCEQVEIFLSVIVEGGKSSVRAYERSASIKNSYCISLCSINDNLENGSSLHTGSTQGIFGRFFGKSSQLELAV